MSTHRTTTSLIIGALAGLALLAPAPPARAQDQPPRHAPAGEADPQSAERDVLRQRVTRQLESIRERERRLEQALKLLDEGRPVEEIREVAADRPELPDRMRDRMRDRIGAGEGFRGEHWRDRPDAGPHGADRPPLAPDDIPRLMDFVERHNPELASDLRTLAEKDPEAFRTKLGEMAPRIEWAMSRAEDRPERFKAMMRFREIDRRAHRLARAIADDAPNAADLTLQLRQAVADGFDLRVRLTAMEVEDLRSKLEDLERRTSRWSQERDRMIDGRVKELIEGARSGDPGPMHERDFSPPDRGARGRGPGGPPPARPE